MLELGICLMPQKWLKEKYQRGYSIACNKLLNKEDILSMFDQDSHQGFLQALMKLLNLSKKP